MKIPSMPKLLEKPENRGKHIIIIAGKVFIAKTGTEVVKIVERERKKHPGAAPEIGFMPNVSSLIV